MYRDVNFTLHLNYHIIPGGASLKEHVFETLGNSGIVDILADYSSKLKIINIENIGSLKPIKKQKRLLIAQN